MAPGLLTSVNRPEELNKNHSSGTAAQRVSDMFASSTHYVDNIMSNKKPDVRLDVDGGGEGQSGSPLGPSRKRVKIINNVDEAQAKYSQRHVENNDQNKSSLDIGRRLQISIIRHAINDAEQGDMSALHLLISQLSSESSPEESFAEGQLVTTLAYFCSEITHLTSAKYARLINAIIDLPFFSYSSDVMEVYFRFIGVLVSAMPKWWGEVGRRIVRDFVRLNTQYHHLLLQHILKLIPTSSPLLLQLILKAFPHKSEETKMHSRYIKNILHVIEYCPEIRKGIWGIMFERLVSIDVEIQQSIDEDDDDDDDDDDEEDEEDDDDGGDNEETTLNKENAVKLLEQGSENESSESNEDREDMSDYEMEETPQGNIRVLSTKLDSLMLVLLNYLQVPFSRERIDSAETGLLFSNLLEHFSTYLLPTYRTRTVQYLLFETAQSCPEFIDAFLVHLIEIALSPSEDFERRQKAIQYISSFISRAKNLSRSQLLFVVSMLSGWIERYLNERESEVETATSMGRFRVFYSVVQAIFYVFCFRHAQLRVEDAKEVDDQQEIMSGQTWVFDIDRLFQRLITSAFNPLRYCNSIVVMMFAKVAHRQDAVYCFSIIEQNRRGLWTFSGTPDSGAHMNNAAAATATGLAAKSMASVFGKKDSFIQLEGYFPFDPVILRQSRRIIRPRYIEWSDVAGDSESSDLDDTDLDEVPEQDDDDET